MKTIDAYIRQNAPLFDGEEPEHGHMERFSKRLNPSSGTGYRLVLLRVAAVLVLGLVTSYVAFRELGMIERKIGDIAVRVSNPELNEAERYYNSQLTQYYDKIRKLRFNNDQAEKKAVLDELSTMDAQVQDMKHDLRQNPEDERIVNAIINFYQVKIEAMDMIIARAQRKTITIL